ncbi:MAG: thymidine phosphorylase, partial [Rhodoferax sp.]
PFDHNQAALGALTFDVCAPDSGVVTRIDNLQLARIAGLAGAPQVSNAGVDLQSKQGDKVQAGAVLYRVHASFAADLEFARQACRKSSGYAIGDIADMAHVFGEC